MGFLNALDARVRNLVALGKRVFLTGDLNIIREGLDSANAAEQLRKHGLTVEEYISTPARRLFNQLLVDGKVIGQRDEGREKPVLWDICRVFHPNRTGMFTCWEQKINARPGNYGSRIDYVLCSLDCIDWFEESNIQEGLLGSDHCPVYAIIKDKVVINGTEVHIKDLMNPTGVFEGGIRKRDWTSKDLLPMSAKLIPEFDRRRSIRDMFVRKPSLPSRDSPFEISDRKKSLQAEEGVSSPSASGTQAAGNDLNAVDEVSLGVEREAFPTITDSILLEPSTKDIVPASQLPSKRPSNSPSAAAHHKRGKVGKSGSSSISSKNQLAKGQSSLTGFFRPKMSKDEEIAKSMCRAGTAYVEDSQISSGIVGNNLSEETSPAKIPPIGSQQLPAQNPIDGTDFPTDANSKTKTTDTCEEKTIIDPIVSKENWGKLLSKRVAPKCEHNEPCVSLLTRKPGINCGRSFYICPRPLGPSGVKEKGTEWRCGTFIWSSDWTGDITT